MFLIRIYAVLFGLENDINLWNYAEQTYVVVLILPQSDVWIKNLRCFRHAYSA